MTKRIRALFGIAAISTVLGLALPTAANASVQQQDSRTASNSAGLAAASTPCSPDGVCDSRLCKSANFGVLANGGIVLHQFTFLSAIYITGGIQRKWSETSYFAGVPYSGYTFNVDCY